MQIMGKVAVVTGAGSGIGKASASALARAGAMVVVGDVDDAGGKETVAAIEAGGGEAAFVAADVTDPGQVEALFNAAVERFGGIDIVHNNAGIVCGEPLWPATEADVLLRQVLVNLGGVVIGTRLAIDHLTARGGGAIVNTGSVGSLLPLADEPAYSATKAGVLMFTKACAGLRDSHNIRVNAVLPALIDTPLLVKTGDGSRPAGWVDNAAQMLPLSPPEDVAAVVLELITDESLAGEYRFAGSIPEAMRAMLGS